MSATLETRPLASDIPFAVAFDDPAKLAEAARDVVARSVPLWHLGLVNAPTARIIGRLEGEHILYGAYPGERSPEVQDSSGKPSRVTAAGSFPLPKSTGSGAAGSTSAA